MYLNKATVLGNLVANPELRTLPSGTKVAALRIATNRVWKNVAGERKQSAEYHNVTVFGPQAEAVAMYLKKGRLALVEGRLATRTWVAQDNTPRHRTEIIAERVQFGPKGKELTQTVDVHVDDQVAEEVERATEAPAE